MTDTTDFSDLYGLSVDTKPKYANDKQRAALRQLFWTGDAIQPELKRHLENAAMAAMRGAIQRDLPALTNFGVRAEASLMNDTDEDGYYEWFLTEVDVLFKPDDYDDVADAVEAPTTSATMIEAIQSAFESYAEAKQVSMHALVMEHEVSEYGGS